MSIFSSIGNAIGKVGNFLGTAAGSTVAGIGSNLISNIFNKSSTDSTNKANLQIAQMNNQWSEKMMQKQMDYNTQMWNKTNDYNSAINQRKRLEEAGLNPSLMMNGGSAGVAQSASSPSLPSPAQASVQPNRYDFSGIGQAVQNAYIAEGQRNQMDANARFLNTQADWYSAKALAELNESFSRNHGNWLDNKAKSIQNSWLNQMLGEDYLTKIRSRQSVEASILNTIKQGVLLDKQISRYDEETNARIADLVASASLKMAQGKLSERQLVGVIQDNIGKILSNKEKNAIFAYVVEQAKNAAKRSGEPQNIWQGLSDAKSGVDKWFDDNVVKPTKKAWKDTRRSFGF